MKEQYAKLSKFTKKIERKEIMKIRRDLKYLLDLNSSWQEKWCFLLFFVDLVKSLHNHLIVNKFIKTIKN